jgi:hypothetical protein
MFKWLTNPDSPTQAINPETGPVRLNCPLQVWFCVAISLALRMKTDFDDPCESIGADRP